MKLKYPANFLELFLKELNIPVSSTTIKKETLKHPNNNTILGFSELMDTWRIPNAACKLDFDELLKPGMPYPYITSVDANKFIVVKSYDQNKFITGDDANKNYTIELERFRANYQGWVFIAEKNEGSGEKEYRKNRSIELLNAIRTPAIIIGVILCLIILYNKQPAITRFIGWRYYALIAIKTFGVFTSILLLLRFAGIENDLLSKICRVGKNDCNSLMMTSAAKVTSWLSWSEIGFFYFAGTWLTCLLNIGQLPIFTLMALLNFIGLPYTVFSIYYQWRVAKNWCVLCCVIQALLWIEFVFFIPFFNHLDLLANLKLDPWVVEMLAPVLLWAFIKPYLARSVKAEYLEDKLTTVKSDVETFNYLNHRSKKIELLPENRSIILGNPDAEKIITLVTDPFCKPCSKAHKVLDHLLSIHDNIKLQVVFFRTQDDKNSDKTKFAADMTDIFLLGGSEQASLALNAWYADENKNYRKWSQKFPVENSVAAESYLNSQRNWCRAYEITATPTVFINKYKLSDHYDIEDIAYLI